MKSIGCWITNRDNGIILTLVVEQNAYFSLTFHQILTYFFIVKYPELINEEILIPI